MQRREFLAASGAAALGMMSGSMARGADETPSRALLELRTYHFASDEKLKAYDAFLASAGVAALNRAGVSPVGVFRVTAKDNPDLKIEADVNELWVLLPVKTFETMLALDDRLADDAAYQSAGKGILDDKMKNPSFTRYETSLLQAFPGFPQVEVPTKSPDRIMQLRRYESHNRERARKKLEMFNVGGELTVFKESGMTGVFFGEALAGPRMPNLTYMLAFDNPAAGKAGWAKFGKHPIWKKLNADPAYKDTVSQITNLFVRPMSSSQI
jgi:NIPSNAP protein